MPDVIAKRVAAAVESASWIREMFERGVRLKAERGADKVFDFSLGNPNAPLPPAFHEALRAVAAEKNDGLHRYMQNAGFPDTRKAIANYLSSVYPLEFGPNDLVITSGAAGGANVALRAIVEPGDEVIVNAPFFPEYRAYIENAGGVMKVVPTDAAYQLDLTAIETAISPRTRAVMVCSPNNPSGAVYGEETLAALGQLLSRREGAEAPIYLLCDDVYHRVVFETGVAPAAAAHYHRALVLGSYSKDIGIAGERIGWVAIPRSVPGRDKLYAAIVMLNRTLGFVNASGVMQRVVARCADAMCDLAFYRKNRDLLYDGLREAGYELPKPGGALFMFPRTPIEDDVAFVSQLMEHGVLVVPGSGFGAPGHIRVSFCVPRETIERGLPGFAAALRQAKANA